MSQPYSHIPTPSRLLQGRMMHVLLILCLVAQLPLSDGRLQLPAIQPSPATSLGQAAQQLAKLPLAFIPNQGQTDPSVRYQVRSRAGTLAFTPDKVVLTLTPAQAGGPQPNDGTQAQAGEQNVAAALLSVQFTGADTSARLESLDQLPGKVNYLIGNDPAKWQTDLPTYAGIVYRDLYPGINLRYDGHEGMLKGTYIVAPGADPNAIRWHYSGASSVALDPQTGNLLITPKVTGATSPLQISEMAPVAWQEIAGNRTPVEARYTLAENGLLQFALGAYNHDLPLIIDPTLIFSTYLGGTNDDYGTGLAIDAQANLYLTGQTSSNNLITNTSLLPYINKSDAFIIKLNPTGTAMIYSTYFGGSDTDIANGIAVDRQGNAYITGQTFSADFVTTKVMPNTYHGGSGDAFVVKLGPGGDHIVYSMFLGGSASDAGYGVAADSLGNAYVTGFTYSNDFPVTVEAIQPTPQGSSDAFVTCINATGSALLYSTYLGGSNLDVGRSLTIDSQGNAYITGYTRSTNFYVTPNAKQPTNHGGFDAFVAKMNTNGTTMVYSTYLGGSSDDYSYTIIVDVAGNSYIAGVTSSTDFNVTPNAKQQTNAGNTDSFVAKLNAAGDAFIYSTYLGGNGFDNAFSVAVDTFGNAYVTGYTYQQTGPNTFPITDNARQTVYGGGYDAFLTEFNPTGTTIYYSTYFGGSKDDGGGQVVVDLTGNVYVTGYTASTNFITTTNALQPAKANNPSNPSAYDAFVLAVNVPCDVPCMTVAPLTLPYYTPVGATTSPTSTFYIGNSGIATTTLSWNINSIKYGPGASNWLSLSPMNGTIPGNTKSMIVYSATNTSNLPTGIYTATFKVSSPDPTALGTPQDVTVKLFVGSPILTTVPPELTFRVQNGVLTQTSQILQVYNKGESFTTLDWSIDNPVYGPGASGWLSCTPTSGTNLMGRTTAPVTCNVNPTLPLPGTVTATLKLNSPSYGVIGSGQTVTVTIKSGEKVFLPVALRNTSGGW